MPKLSAYDKKLDYSYALGMFPATECLRAAPERCLRLLYQSGSAEAEGVRKLRLEAEAAGVRCEEADRILRSVSSFPRIRQISTAPPGVTAFPATAMPAIP